MDIWNGQHAIFIYKMPTNIQKDDEHHNMQTTQYNLSANSTMDPKQIVTKW